jgi:hypothetical protein
MLQCRMRTTLVLTDAAYEMARSLAYAQHRTLGEVVSELILKPKTSAEKLGGPNALGFYTFSTQEPLTVNAVRDLLDDE